SLGPRDAKRRRACLSRFSDLGRCARGGRRSPTPTARPSALWTRAPEAVRPPPAPGFAPAANAQAGRPGHSAGAHGRRRASEHAPYVASELPDGPAPHVLLQPEERGTGAAVLFAAHRIREWDPSATLAFFPSDHFILEEEAFLAHVGKVAAFVARH